MRHERQPVAESVFHGSAHQLAVADWLAIICYRDNSGFFHLTIFSKTSSFAFVADCAGRINPRWAVSSFFYNKTGYRGSIVDWFGVWHADNGGKAASCCRTGAAFNGFFIFLAGFSQMNVHINETRRDPFAGCIDNLSCCGIYFCLLHDCLTTDINITYFIAVVGGVKNSAISKKNRTLHDASPVPSVFLPPPITR